MAHLAGTDRSQSVLLPEVLDDYVRHENPVRFLDAFVAQLDLGALGFQRAVPAETGRPGYDPGDLLRLYLSPRPMRRGVSSPKTISRTIRRRTSTGAPRGKR